MSAVGRPAARLVSQRALLAAAVVIALLEGYDLSCYGVTVPSILADRSMGISVGKAGHIGSVVAVGMLVGAGFTGAFSRRFAPRLLVLWSTVVFSAGMVMCAAAGREQTFSAGRFVVGVGLGVVLPTITAMVADLSRPAQRSRNIGLMMAGYALGGLCAPLLGKALLPGSSFRWIYLAGTAVGVLALPVVWVLLPESPVHLLRRGRTAEAEAIARDLDLPAPRLGEVPVRRHLFGLAELAAPGYRVMTGLFWVMSFCGLLLVFGISTWLPKILLASGYSLGSALTQTCAMWIGAGAGMIAGGWAADALGPKRVVATAFLVGAASLLAMSTQPRLGVLILLMFVSGLGFIGSQVLVNGFIASQYPDDVRHAALGWALTAGRGGAILGPTLGSAIADSSLGIDWNFYIFAVPGAVGALATALVPVRRLAVAGRRAPAMTGPVVRGEVLGDGRAE